MSFFLAEHDLIKKSFEESTVILNQSAAVSNGFIGTEIKLTTDVELDQYFRNYLEKHTKYPVYSEESLGSTHTKGQFWIVDPLDGSLNFFRNIPFYTSSIALWSDGSPLLGFVYDYARQDFYFGEVGIGATLNGSPIKVSTIEEKKGIKLTGIPSHTNTGASLEMFESSLNHYKKLRWMGCASLSLCYVASARSEAYEELGIKLWDVAAGMAIVLAAGGKVQHELNSDGSLNLIATNGVANV